jgi:O-methyltransferase
MTPPVDRPYRLAELSDELGAYLRRISRPDHVELAALRERTAALPFVAMMQGSRTVAQLLQFLIRLIGAREVVEVGVFTGCSTLAMATALPPGGRIVAVDVSERWPAIGKEFWTRSGYADRIDLRIGPANDVLDAMIEGGMAGAFDLVFVDANKDGYDGYFDRALALLRQDGLMVFDNVLFGGRVQPSCTEPQIRQELQNRPKFLQDLYVRYTEGLRQFNERIARDDRVDVVVLPMIDGVTLARKRPSHA